MSINTIKKRLPFILGFLVATLLIVYVIYSYHYLQASEADFSLNEEQYMKIIRLLDNPEYADVKSFGPESIEFTWSKPDDYKQDKNRKYEPRYILLMSETAKLSNTYFLKCPKGIIKISKLSWIDSIFETAYVYSPDGFNPTPENMFKKINDHVITYHNYDGTLTGSNDCDVR